MRAYKYIFIFLITILCCSVNVFAQNIQSNTIEWNCISTFTAQPGNIIDETTRVVSSAEQIIWYDAEDNVKMTLTVTNFEGTWNNVSSNGSILAKVTSGNNSGIVQFYRTNGVAGIRIQLVLEEEAPIYELTVGNVNTL